MAYINDRISGFLGYMAARAIAGQRNRRENPGNIKIDVLAATFDPLTAEAVIGESGTLGGDTEFVIGYTGQPIYYQDGHLIVEDTQ